MANDHRNLSLLKNFAVASILVAAVAVFTPTQIQADENGSFFELSLEELLEIKVTSASRYPQSLLESPNAIWVVTAERSTTLSA